MDGQLRQAQAPILYRRTPALGRFQNTRVE